MISIFASRARGLWAVLFATGLTAISLRAEAQSASTNETARQLLIDGLDLRDAQQLDAALEKLTAAHALVHTPVTGLELGRTHLVMGHLVEACDMFREVVRLPEDRETPRTRAARVEAKELAEATAARTPSLRLKISAPAGSTPDVRVDGEVIPPAAMSLPRKVNPGKHVVSGQIAGQPPQRAEVIAEIGKEVAVVLALGAAPPQRSGAPEAEKPRAASDRPLPPFLSNPLVLTGFGVAGAGLVLGGVTGIITLSKASSLKDDCENNHCPPDRFDDLDSARTFGTVSTLSFAVAGVGAAAGITGLFLSKPLPEKAGLVVYPILTPGGFGLSGIF